MSLRKIPTVPINDSPVFIDKAIGQMQTILKASLSWLDYSFGRAQKLVTTKDNQNYFYPGVHYGYGDYVNVLPDQELGNFSFFIVEDPQPIEYNARSFNIAKLKYSLIVWVNLDKIFVGVKDRNSEEIKLQIMELITRTAFLNYGRFTIENIYEQSENIYKGYSLKEIDSQYLMQPFYGFRFEGQLTLQEECVI
ncbi:MAG: hypothetical protein HQ522_07850 [Bacteroidetes bacterium]|nr:hypothetical protein [Bacteroidota bacterium]